MIVQAGSSEPGRKLAAETAEVVFAAESKLEANRYFHVDVKGRMRTIGREPEHLETASNSTIRVRAFYHGNTALKGYAGRSSPFSPA